MPVTYTITNTDESTALGISAQSRVKAGVVFNWDAQTISIPAVINQVDSLFLISNCRWVEENLAGIARPQIVDGGGKTRIGTDIDTNAAIETPPVAILRDEWKIVTLKTSGSFVVKDIYPAIGSTSPVPYENVTGVFIQYLTSVTGAVAFLTTGGVSPTQQQIRDALTLSATQSPQPGSIDDQIAVATDNTEVAIALSAANI